MEKIKKFKYSTGKVRKSFVNANGQSLYGFSSEKDINSIAIAFQEINMKLNELIDAINKIKQ